MDFAMGIFITQFIGYAAVICWIFNCHRKEQKAITGPEETETATTV